MDSLKPSEACSLVCRRVAYILAQNSMGPLQRQGQLLKCGKGKKGETECRTTQSLLIIVLNSQVTG